MQKNLGAKAAKSAGNFLVIHITQIHYEKVKKEEVSYESSINSIYIITIIAIVLIEARELVARMRRAQVASITEHKVYIIHVSKIFKKTKRR